MIRSVLGVLVLASTLAMACSRETTAPTSPSGSPPETAPTSADAINTELTLVPGQRTSVAGTDLALRFTGVPADSRCPADAFCVQVGDAVAVFDATFGTQPSSRLELRTSDTGRAGSIGTYQVELLALQPYPFGSKPIDPSEYRASVRVSSR